MEWWEIVVLFRKTAIAIALVFVKDTFLQSLLATCILLVAAFVQSTYRPYSRAVLNRVELLGLLVALVTQLVSIFYFWLDEHSDEMNDSSETIITIVLLVLNIDAAVAFVLYISIALRANMKKFVHQVASAWHSMGKVFHHHKKRSAKRANKSA